jgi:GAF domain-containing protein
MPRALVGWLLAAFCLVMLALAWGEYYSPLTKTTFGIPGAVAYGNEARVTEVTPGTDAAAQGVQPGDVIEVSALSLSDRLRFELEGSPVGTTIALPVIHHGSLRIVRLTSRNRSLQAQSESDPWSLLFEATFTLLIVGYIALRRPSLATAMLVWYAAGSVNTGPVATQFSWIPNPWFGLIATVILAAFSTLPLVALLPFLARFPELPSTRAGIVRMRVADAIFIAGAVIFTMQVLYEPMLFATWYAFDVWGSVVITAVVIAFAALSYHDASGEARRRIGWVIGGIAVSAVAYTGFNVYDTFVIASGTQQGALNSVFGDLSQVLNCALPLALAYAVLRHRVLDIGFALNRTVVYGVMTALVVVVVSLIDWLTSRLLNEQRLALTVEAIVTISFGFALNWIHAHTERLIDRIVFRERHLAEKRIEYRIHALAFASNASAVDEALAQDAPRILGLSSAAVFGRLSNSEPFRLNASTGWSGSAIAEIDDNSILIRTLRSLERPVVLDDVAIALEGAPAGELRPVLAIPIVTQHELTGFALFGNRRDGALPDPEEIGLLAKLCAAAGNAYGAVEARQWRDRAASLERSLSAMLPSV